MNELLKIIDDRIENKLNKTKLINYKPAIVKSTQDNTATVKMLDSKFEYTLPNRSGIFLNIGDMVQICYKGNNIDTNISYISSSPNGMVVCDENKPYDKESAVDNILYFVPQDDNSSGDSSGTGGSSNTDTENTNNTGIELTKTISGSTISISDGELDIPFNSVYIEPNSDMPEHAVDFDKQLSGSSSGLGTVLLGSFVYNSLNSYGLAGYINTTDSYSLTRYPYIWMTTDSSSPSSLNTGTVITKGIIGTSLSSVPIQQENLNKLQDGDTIYVYFKEVNPSSDISLNNIKITGYVLAQYNVNLKYYDGDSTSPSYTVYRLPVGETITDKYSELIHKYQNEKIECEPSCNIEINYNL